MGSGDEPLWVSICLHTVLGPCCLSASVTWWSLDLPWAVSSSNKETLSLEATISVIRIIHTSKNKERKKEKRRLRILLITFPQWGRRRRWWQITRRTFYIRFWAPWGKRWGHLFCWNGDKTEIFKCLSLNIQERERDEIPSVDTAVTVVCAAARDSISLRFFSCSSLILNASWFFNLISMAASSSSFFFRTSKNFLLSSSIFLSVSSSIFFLFSW